MWRAPGSIRGRICAVYLAYNFFRLAAILQGIVGRVRDGTATNENAPARAQMVRPLAATAWEFAQRGGREVKKLRARARRRRRARACAYRDARGARRDRREAGRDRRLLDRRGDRRGLCGRHDRPRDAPPSHRAGARPRRGVAPRDGRARAAAWSEILGAGFGNPLRGRWPQVLRRVPGRTAPGRFSRSRDSAHRAGVRPARAREAVVFSTGPLKPAIAASMAIPGLVRPVEIDGRVLVDGGAVDPLPFDAAARQGRRHRRGRRLGRRDESGKACPTRGKACSPRSR